MRKTFSQLGVGDRIYIHSWWANQTNIYTITKIEKDDLAKAISFYDDRRAQRFHVDYKSMDKEYVYGLCSNVHSYLEELSNELKDYSCRINLLITQMKANKKMTQKKIERISEIMQYADNLKRIMKKVVYLSKENNGLVK